MVLESVRYAVYRLGKRNQAFYQRVVRALAGLADGKAFVRELVVKIMLDMAIIFRDKLSSQDNMLISAELKKGGQRSVVRTLLALEMLKSDARAGLEETVRLEVSEEREVNLFEELHTSRMIKEYDILGFDGKRRLRYYPARQERSAAL